MKVFHLAVAVLMLVGGACSRTVGPEPTASSSGTGEHGPYVTLTDASFDTEVLASTQPVLVDFWATWCPPCRAMAPVVSELAADFEGKAKIAKLDVDSNPQSAKKYGISGIPAFLIFKDGKLVETIVGLRPKAELAAKLTALTK